MDKVKVGFIGAGRISDLHAIEYGQNPNAELVALCDANPAIAAAQAEAWGLSADRVFGNWGDLLALDELDMVEILLPHHLHCPATLAAIEAGKHVSVQKPMALTLDEADRMVAAAKAKDVVLRVFENFVHYPPVTKAKALIDAGAIGAPLTIRIKSNAGIGKNAWLIPVGTQAAWRLDPATCGGGPLVFDDGHHKFALAWFFMGPALEVHAWIEHTEVAGGLLDSPAMISFRFPGQRFGNLEVVHSAGLEIDTVHYPQDDRVEITGTEGVLWITRGHGKIGDQPPVVLYRDGETRGFSVASGWEQSFVHSTRHLIEALRTGQPPSLTGEQGREVLRFALAAQESARKGRSVRLE